MQAIIKKMMTLSLVVGAVLMNNAQAQLNMSEKEHTQAIVWIVEAATFVTTIAIVLIVWRISKRDKKERGASRSTDK
jgi:heme/copper-type cytochrome/quinol oxidase subunit 2